jgi:hypothetical protein
MEDIPRPEEERKIVQRPPNATEIKNNTEIPHIKFSHTKDFL